MNKITRFMNIIRRNIKTSQGEKNGHKIYEICPNIQGIPHNIFLI